MANTMSVGSPRPWLSDLESASPELARVLDPAWAAAVWALCQDPATRSPATPALLAGAQAMGQQAARQGISLDRLHQIYASLRQALTPRARARLWVLRLLDDLERETLAAYAAARPASRPAAVDPPAAWRLAPEVVLRPLTLATGWAQLLAQRLSRDPADQLLVRMAERAVAYTFAVVRRLRDLDCLERLQAGPLALAPTAVALPPLVQHIVARAQPLGPGQPIRLESAPNLPPVLADRAALAHALGDILDSLLLAPTPATRIRLALGPAPDGQLALLQVEGQGLRLDPDSPPLPRGVVPGGGSPGVTLAGRLALWVAGRLIEAQGGVFQVASQPEGCTIIVKLPFAPERREPRV